MARVLDQAYDNPQKLEEHAVAPLAGGIMQHGYQCGMIWGSALSAGSQAYKVYGAGAEAETRAILASKAVVEAFEKEKNTINCLEITSIDKSSSSLEMFTYFFLKGGTIGCFRMSAKMAAKAFDQINTSFAEEKIDVPPTPVSCATVVAEKMGASEKHKHMAAGFAGGIGLCGGACGALGAAIWINSMRKSEDGKKIDFKDPDALEIVEKFIKSSDYRFECMEIVGRIFESPTDHAEYIQKGGCAEIINTLAEQ